MPELGPNLFIAGAPKAGTTALAMYLAEHPQVYLCTPKEPGYWASDLPSALHERYGIHAWEDYVRLFDSAAARSAVYRGEASTQYLMSERALRRIVGYDRRARIVVMLRNPVELAHAFHGQALFGRYEDTADFEIAWYLQDERLQGHRIPRCCRVPAFLQYRHVAALGTHLERVCSVVPSGNLYIGFFEDFCADAGESYRAVLDFLRLRDDGRTEFPPVNPAKQQRFPLLANWVHAPPARFAPAVQLARRLYRTRRLGSRNLATRLMTRESPRQPLRPGFRRELAAYFDPEISKLESITGRDLAHWRV